MTTRKTTTTDAPSGESGTGIPGIDQMKSQNAAADAVGNGHEDATAKQGTVNWAELAKRYNAAMVALRTKESDVDSARVAQIALVRDVDSTLTAAGSEYYGKKTPQTVKRTGESHFPILGKSQNTGDAITRSLCGKPDDGGAGMATRTASNLLKLARDKHLPALCTDGHDGVKLPYGVAYRLAATKELDSNDYTAALLARLTPAQVPAWLLARAACKTIAAQWGVYQAHTVKRDAAGTVIESTESTDAQRAEAADDMKTADEHARIAWRTIDDSCQVIATNYAAALHDYDSALETAVKREKTRIAKLAEAQRDAAKRAAEDAAAQLPTAQEERDRLEEERRQKAETRVAMVTKGSVLQKEIDSLRGRIEKGDEDARKVILAELKKKQAELRHLEPVIKTAKAEEELARNAADNAAKGLVTLTATIATKQAEAQRVDNETPHVPAIRDWDDALKHYRKMTPTQVNAELREMAAWMQKANLVPEWLADGYARRNGMIE